MLVVLGGSLLFGVSFLAPLLVLIGILVFGLMRRESLFSWVRLVLCGLGLRIGGLVACYYGFCFSI